MITVFQDKLFYNLDSIFDIKSFLSLEDDFYQMFAKNYSKSSSVWAAGGLDLKTNHSYVKNNPFLYHTFHNKKFNFSFDSEEKKFGQGSSNSIWSEELAVYLQLKFGAVNPYKFLHLVDHKNNSDEVKISLNDWVFDYPSITKWIDELPFSNFENISLIYTPKFVQQGYHRDFNLYPIEKPDKVYSTMPELNVDVLWCRFNLDRPFYLYDIDSNGEILREIPLEGYAATFNHFNWHGNINPADAASLTIKVEGDFLPQFKQQIFETD